MRISQLNEKGFIDTLTGLGRDILNKDTGITDVSKSNDPNVAGPEMFQKQFMIRGLNAFASAFNNDGIDLNKSGLDSSLEKVAANLGFNQKGTQTAQQPKAAGKTTPAQQPTAGAKTAPAKVPQGGGKVPGQLSQTPNAIKKRQQRAASKTVAPKAGQQPATTQPATAQPGQPTASPIVIPTTYAKKQTPGPVAAPAAPAAKPASATPAAGRRAKAATAVKKAVPKQAAQPTMRIGKQKLNPNDPAHAKIIQKIQAQQAGASKSVQESIDLTDKKYAEWNTLLESLVKPRNKIS